MYAHFSRCCLMAGLLIAGAVRGAQAPIVPEGGVVTLPPLIVEESKVPLKWRYFQGARLEVLTTASDAKSAAVVERTLELDYMLASLLPARYLAMNGSALEKLILLDADTIPTPSRELLDEVTRRVGPRVQFLPNMGLVDKDVAMTLAMVSKSADDFVYSEERIAAVLAARRPRLPEWFQAGMKGLYHQLAFKSKEIEVRPLDWVPLGEMMVLRRDPEMPRTLQPIADMLDPQPEKARTGTRASAWRAQCTLFVHWALISDDGAHREAMWSFLDRLEKEPMSEQLFFDVFGLGYADMRDQLSDYLPRAVQPIPKLKVPWPSGQGRPRATFRDATDAEVARIRGDLERLEANYVRTIAPQLVDTYLKQARRTIHRAYDAGERDPQLLAVAGLTELDGGQPEAARPLLEAAAEAHATRPRAYFELARLRFEQAAATAGATTRLNRQQVDAVTAPLLAAHRLKPPLLEVYALMVNVLVRGENPPTAEELAALNAGAEDFSHVSELVARVIALHRAAGQPAAAAALVQTGLLHAPDAAGRALIERAATARAQTKGE